MKLHDMKPTPGSRPSKKRIGRGDKTAGRGENGQKSRAGYSAKIGFEGGQNPLYRRLPKRGFSNAPFKKEYTIVNLEAISKLGLKDVKPTDLIEAKIIRKNYGLLKVLSNGEMKEAINVSAHKFSKSAQVAIKNAGGKVVFLKEKTDRKDLDKKVDQKDQTK
ncbi:MAG: 50S ribosomal protein L15 [Candidatus Tyloplasma litorale]|nr:MAG: 50S ribosomal protein L15 [Mycoplasmatales bacterium]